MTKFYAQEKRVFDINKVTVVGSPTITSDGVASGFLVDTATGYDTTKTCIQTNGFTLGQLKNKPYKIVCEFELRDLLLYSLGYTFPWQAWSNCLFVENSQFVIPARFGTSEKNTGNIQAVSWVTFDSLGLVYGNHYIYEVSFDGVSLYTYKLKNIDGSIIKSWTYTPTSEDKNLYEVNLYPDEGIQVGTCCIAYSNRWSGYKGQIDLTAFKIYVDGELVYSPTKPTYLLERRKEGFDLSKFTVVGNPTITSDGVASGFSNANVIRTPEILWGNSLKVSIRFNLSSLPHYACLIGGVATNKNSIRLTVQPNGELRLNVSDDGSINYTVVNNLTCPAGTISLNNWYDVDVVFDGVSYKVYVNGNLLAEKASDKLPYNAVLQIGSERSDTNYGMVQGSINLPSTSITVDGKEVFTGAKEKFYAMQGGI